MNYCTHCGAPLDGAVNFCKNCGEKLDKGKSLALSAKPPEAKLADGQATPVANETPTSETNSTLTASVTSRNPPTANGKFLAKGKKLALSKKLAQGKFLAFIIGAGAAVLAFALVLVFTVFLNKPETEHPLTVAELLDLGEKYLLDLDYEQALVQYLAVIEIEPKNPRAYTGAAEAYIGLGDNDSAVAVLERGAQALPENAAIQEMFDNLRLGGAAKTITLRAVADGEHAQGQPISDEEAYADAFNDFVTRDTDDYRKMFISIAVYGDKSLSDLKYAFYDIDRNGIEELIISDDENGYGGGIVYTLSNGRVVELIYYWGERSVFKGITEDGYIVGWGSGGAATEYHHFDKIAGDGTGIVSTMLSTNPKDDWNWDAGQRYDIESPDGSREITEREYNEFIETNATRFVELDWMPLTPETGMAGQNHRAPVSVEVKLLQVTIGGTPAELVGFRVDGNTYYNLRDVAMALDRTGNQFDIAYNDRGNELLIHIGRQYTPIGGEMSQSGEWQTAAPAEWTATVDGAEKNILSYKIGADHYFTISDIAWLIEYDNMQEQTQVADDNTYLYADIISAFMRYEESGWTDFDTILAADSFLITSPPSDISIPETISGLSGYGDSVSLRYGMHDINGNGQPELIIGIQGGIQGEGIISVYTISDGAVLPVTQPSLWWQTGISTPQIYDDYTIKVTAGGSQRWTEQRWSILPDFQVRLEYSLQTYYYPLPEDRFEYHYTDANGNRLVSSAEAQQLISQYSTTPAVSDWHPLSHFFGN